MARFIQPEPIYVCMKAPRVSVLGSHPIIPILKGSCSSHFSNHHHVIDSKLFVRGH